MRQMLQYKKGEMGNKAIIDPKTFITPPYTKCPQCEKAECYGLLMIGGNSYTKRCKECWSTESYQLPNLNKKIIYLDQFVISEMMKALKNKTKIEKETDKFWLKLFEKLDRLTKLQLIICPDSNFQYEESLHYEFEAHKQMYEHLSHGITFYDKATIQRFQLIQQFKKSLGIKVDALKKEDVISSRINGWQEKLRISMNFKSNEEEIIKMKQGRSDCCNEITKVFKKWQKEKQKKFKDWYKEEAMAWGLTKAQIHIEKMKKEALFEHGHLQLKDDEVLSLFLGDEKVLIYSLMQTIPKEKEDQMDSWEQVLKFLISEEILEVPFNHISSLLWAGIAYQAAIVGRKHPPGSGMPNDIDMVGILLPYCDAIFVDREMHGLLNMKEVAKEVGQFKTEIFSAKNKKDFFEYLDEIEKNASRKHMGLVKKVYGKDWPKPYWEMYENKDHKKSKNKENT